MNKALRQRAVLEALRQGPVANQEDLQRALRKRGFKVGQATLSRDIRRSEFKQNGVRLHITSRGKRCGSGFAPGAAAGSRVCTGCAARAEPVGGENDCRQRSASGGSARRAGMGGSGGNDCR